MKIEKTKIDSVKITEQTKMNIIRKSDFVDDVQITNKGTPLFSWIDISLTELCNRLCVFCPRIDSNVYPNQNLHMSLGLLDKINEELVNLKYRGGVVFCGYGEPLLHPQIKEIISIFGNEIRTEIVTNGDKLSVDLILDLFDRGLSFLCVSMYDGPHQVKYFTDMMNGAGLNNDQYILRDRWHTEEDQFGLKLTNRGGTINFGEKVITGVKKPCFYLAYSLAIDWNGDMVLCVQDWQKKIKLGNASQDNLLDVWESPRITKLRNKLIQGDRSDSPCKDCNTDGTFHGFNHVEKWMSIK
ncbi:radical SAM/SPASM domain-containing protein [Candidatus Methylopumilus planktonicus]|uniref:radical SAM/SPASM domain-containing protein n=1 Tax=Candidatus Methylopumilus planktonicus TaxID=1581557 RepID=UPI001121C5D4|nr:SPASM domain-containing protein [Candidatus Methylopumilus planktonicus]QDD11389.1 radical SAM protein [Candidatus Methylopumilus planktonicus]QDD23860.1 radical SAM protein [Candidatus Methylopumilus planktonicus]